MDHNWCKYCDEEFSNKVEVAEHIDIIHGVHEQLKKEHDFQ